MLRKDYSVMTYSVKVAIVAALSCGAVQSFAQPASAPAQPSALSLADIKKGGASEGVLSAVKPEDLKRAEDNAQSAVRNILEAYERNMPAATERLAPAQRKSDQIANEAFQAERDRALEFLGIDPQGNTSVSIFLSWSMPIEMLRAYVLDGMWSGANIYFRGVPPGKDLMTFITKDMRSLVYGKNAANLSIDPRMFDAFKVTSVPAIVFSTSREQFSCKGIAPRTFTYKEKALEYDGCNAQSEESYWKVSGAVSTSYALNLFLERGAPGVKPFVDAIAKGYAEGVPPGKSQQAYAGKWEDVLTPEEVEGTRRYEERLKAEEKKKAEEAAAARSR